NRKALENQRSVRIKSLDPPLSHPLLARLRLGRSGGAIWRRSVIGLGDFIAVRLPRPRSRPLGQSEELASDREASSSAELHQALQARAETLCRCDASRPAPLRWVKE